MTKSSASSTKLLLVLLCIIMIGAAFYFGFKNFNDQAKEIEAENVTLDAQIEPLQEKVNNIPTYKAETEANNKKIMEIANKYGSGYTPESLIKKYLEMEEKCELELANVTYTNSSILYQDTNVDTAEGKGLTAYGTEVNVVASTTYEGFKSFCDFINEYTERTTFDNISLSVSEAGFNITTTIKEYAMIGLDNKTYVAPEFENKEFGVDNIFGDLSSTEMGLVAH